MNPDEILTKLYDETLVGNKPAVVELTEQGIATGMAPERLLFDALIPALEEVGARFERGDFFVPEMLISGRAMTGALDLLRPLLVQTGAETIGTFLMGTVKGDVHDIGKNLVDIMLEGAGFKVVDLGVQVAPETFIEAIHEHRPDVVGFSAFLTTTMPMFKVNIEAIEKAGLRDDVDDPGRRRSRDPGVRRRRWRRRLCGRRRERDQAGQGAARRAPGARGRLSDRTGAARRADGKRSPGPPPFRFHT